MDKKKVVLLAEDDPDDRYLIGEAIDETHLPVSLYLVEDGEELLDYLKHRGKFTDTSAWPSPWIVLLDLNMPRKDGREVLGEIKADPDLRHIPIIVLTTSEAEEDINQSYAQGVSGFITKPASFTGLQNVMKAIELYWLKTVETPESS